MIGGKKPSNGFTVPCRITEKSNHDPRDDHRPHNDGDDCRHWLFPEDPHRRNTLDKQDDARDVRNLERCNRGDHRIAADGQGTRTADHQHRRAFGAHRRTHAEHSQPITTNETNPCWKMIRSSAESCRVQSLALTAGLWTTTGIGKTSRSLNCAGPTTSRA